MNNFNTYGGLINANIYSELISQNSEKVPDKKPDKMPDKKPEKKPEKIPEKIPDKKSEKISEKILEKIPDIKSEKISEKEPENIKTNIEIVKNEYILDPLSVIIKLAILSKKPIGTKISMHNHAIYIQEVGIFQPLVRYVFKNNRFDIQYLYNPIEIACNKFIHNDKMKSIFIKAKAGLDNLTKTYKDNSIIAHTLLMYKNIISNHTNTKYDDKLFENDTMTEAYTNEVIEKCNSIWTPNKIKMILDGFDNEDNIEYLEKMMILIDNEIRDKFSKI
jgi:hypothetical protein